MKELYKSKSWFETKILLFIVESNKIDSVVACAGI
jgi:hypothetical protein